jgi:hypothetical protein
MNGHLSQCFNGNNPDMTNGTLFITIVAVSAFTFCNNAQSASVTKLEYGNESGWIRFTEEQPAPKPVTPLLKATPKSLPISNSSVAPIPKTSLPPVGLTAAKPQMAVAPSASNTLVNQPGSKTASQVSSSVKPMTSQPLATKPTQTPTPVPVPKPAPKTWRIEAGIMLKDALFNWAAAEKCSVPGIETWTVVWMTPVKYRVDAPLQFTGDLRTALNSLFTLYGSAKVPLYAGIRSAQCLISVDDKELH